MAISYNKRELEKKKQSKKLEKQRRKEERKANAGDGSLDSMIAYVNEHGEISDTPPDLQNREEIDIEQIHVSVPKKEDLAAEEVVLLHGEIAHFNASKGYGFVKDLETGDKLFFHVSQAYDGVTEGDHVSYDTERGPRGINAVQLVKVHKAS